MNAKDINTDGQSMTVKRRGDSGTLFGDHHPDGSELITRSPRVTGPHAPTGKVCDCKIATIERGSKKIPLLCLSCGGFADKGLTEHSYHLMRISLGLEPEKPELSRESIALIAGQIADRIAHQVADLIVERLDRQHGHVETEVSS